MQLRRVSLALALLPTLHCSAPTSAADDDVASSSAAAAATAGVTTSVVVDCSAADDDVRTQVRYARGWVQPLDLRASTADVAADVTAASGMAPNVVNAVIDLNARANEGLFAYDAGRTTLTAGVERDAFIERLAAVKAAGAPGYVQLSGAPRATPADWLDDVAYAPRENATGNFYPLPVPERMSAVQRALVGLIRDVEATAGLGGNVWTGNQEPSHTAGFTVASVDGATPCVDASTTREERDACRKDNIRRFVGYWRPIAKALRASGIKVGGIQLNSHDRDLYAFAAETLIATNTPVDVFSIQRYSSFDDVVTNAYEVFLRFRATPGYEGTKVMFTRYSFDNAQTPETREAFFASAQGMIQILEDEKQIMEHAEMMAGYAYQTSGVLGATSLVPRVMRWLQAAPAPLRPTRVDVRSPGVGALALVRKDRASKAHVAVWNRSAGTRAVEIVLADAGAAFATNLKVLKGSGTTLAETPATLTRGKVSGFSLGQGELALVSID